jgi:endonuclease YncB( thermonuclease family)
VHHQVSSSSSSSSSRQSTAEWVGRLLSLGKASQFTLAYKNTAPTTTTTTTTTTKYNNKRKYRIQLYDTTNHTHTHYTDTV